MPVGRKIYGITKNKSKQLWIASCRGVNDKTIGSGNNKTVIENLVLNVQVQQEEGESDLDFLSRVVSDLSNEVSTAEAVLAQLETLGGL